MDIAVTADVFEIPVIEDIEIRVIEPAVAEDFPFDAGIDLVNCFESLPDLEPLVQRQTTRFTAFWSFEDVVACISVFAICFLKKVAMPFCDVDEFSVKRILKKLT